jgi:hypothetical protein
MANNRRKESLMTPFKFWTVWLMVGAFTMSAYGVIMVLFDGTFLFAAVSKQVDQVFWLSGPAAPGLAEYQKWVYGVWGATMAGFGLLAALVGGNAFVRQERWARDALAVALLLWYLMGTIISLALHVWVYAALNTVGLALFALPFAFTWRLFKSGTGTQ